MKVRDVLEASVIDFTAARKEKAETDLRDKLQDVAKSFRQHQDYERIASEEFQMLATYLSEFKKRQRLPGFETLDDIGYFLVVDINTPHWAPVRPSEKIKPGTGGYEAHVGEVQRQQQNIRRWFSKLGQSKQRRFQMIVHHLPRLNKALDTLHTEVRKFQTKWWNAYEKKMFSTKLDAMDNAAYLDTEIRRDKELLASVQNIATIIGL